MTNAKSQMRQEIDEIPIAVERLLTKGAESIRTTSSVIRDVDPAFAITVARGSSDHVCTYLKYVSELLLGIPFASVGPSVASLYRARLRLQNSLCLSVSQSGKSPDIIDMAKAARRDGALTVAITNDPNAPLAEASSHVLNLHAGPERSVAATKTFLTSAVAGLLLLAEWRGDRGLIDAIHGLPAALDQATKIDWPAMRDAIGAETSLFTLGRGPAWAMANEAALKFKEVCQIHAESYSSAEVLHGPVSIVDQGFPVLVFAAADAAEDALIGVADGLAEKGARVFVTSVQPRIATAIEPVRTKHPLTDPLVLIVSFYAMVERLAASRGIDPDRPRHLKKVTETV
ncbi:MAG: SIS domain-containing protein [Geminicoccaceae bacterium]